MTAQVLHGNCLDVLPTLADASVDAIVTDPPYELGFMGKAWDAAGVAYDVTLWAECLRVLKPGGHLLAFGGTRTYHRMACAIEDAGFEVRDSLHWLYGSGFPKSLDVSKAIDKAAGAEREVVGSVKSPFKVDKAEAERNSYGAFSSGIGADGYRSSLLTAPATDAARQWSGWGTALKPAHEPIVVARKPLTGTVAGNVLAHGTGALNIDGCRVGVTADDIAEMSGRSGRRTAGQVFTGKGDGQSWEPTAAGRWPANLVFTHAADCVQVSPGASTSTPDEEVAGGIWQPSEGKPAGPTYSDTPAVWRCADGCPVAELDRQSGVSRDGVAVNRNRQPGTMNSWLGTRPSPVGPDVGYGGQGGASRFFTVTEWDPIADVAPFRYVAKPSKSERNAGLEELPAKTAGESTDRKDGSAGLNSPRAGAGRTSGGSNHHPTVKPVALMRWLVRLVTPPGGTVLDPFAGSGTTLVAATLEGVDAVGIEMTDDYLPIIAGRVAWAVEEHARQPLTLFDLETAT